MYKLFSSFIFFFFIMSLSAQTENEIKKYVKEIDALRSANKLTRLDFSEMSGCGGGVDGFYLNDNLVLIDATDSGELGFASRAVYFKDGKVVSILYREHFPEWEKYETKYGKSKFDESKMTYTDTLHTIILTSHPGYTKSAGSKIISKNVDQKRIDDQLSCAEQMRKELDWERKQK
jgi:hypothetical protein